MTNHTRPPTHRTTNSYSRRALLAASASIVAGTAGCLGGVGGNSPDAAQPEPIETDDDLPERPQVTNPPDAVYLPSHRESMVMLSPIEVGEYAISPHVSFPHHFWLVTGTDTEEVAPSEYGVHLMLAVRDAETGQPLPVDTGAEVVVRRDGEHIDQRIPWPMIAQPMGFHFGDNVALPGPGTYTVEVTLNPIGARKTGGFEGRFEERVSTTFEFTYDDEVRQELIEGVTFVEEDRWGTPGALEPMGHDGGGHGGGHDGGHGNGGHDGGGNGHNHGGSPSGMLPPASAYPGRDLGSPSISDAAFVARYLERSRLSSDGGGYLLVSPRTPYNRYPLPDMALSVAGSLDGELVQTIDDELGHHYGLAAELSPGDALELVVETPPQLARHRGYETAFLEAGSMRLEVSE